MSSEKELILVCEGGAHTVEYFHKNGVFPDKVVFTAGKLAEILPYVKENTEVLILVKGLTDFNLMEIYAMLDDLEKAEVRNKILDVTILTNIHLGSIPITYYLYKGDLFYGEVSKVENGKVIVEGTKKTKSQKKSRRQKRVDIEEENVKKVSLNQVANRYKIYSKRKKFTIYGSEERESDTYNDSGNLAEHIVLVDVFKNKRS